MIGQLPIKTHKENNLLDKSFPKLAKEWKTYPFNKHRPEDVTPSSGLKVNGGFAKIITVGLSPHMLEVFGNNMSLLQGFLSILKLIILNTIFRNSKRVGL